MEQHPLKYTVGFVFSADLKKVLLVHKQRPDWQKGRTNGIGGNLNSGESPESGIARETQEEATLRIPPSEWKAFGTIFQERGNVRVFCAVYPGNLSDAARGDYEEVEWFDADSLPENVVDNLRWMIPLALEVLTANRSVDFSVRYS